MAPSAFKTGATLRPLPLLALVLLLAALQGCALVRPKEPDAELRRQAGQMLLVGFRGTEPAAGTPQALPILEIIPRLNLGGVILFSRDAELKMPPRNIADPEQTARLTAALARAAAQAGMPPLFIALDQEGGRVQRLSPLNGFPGSPAAAELCPIPQPGQGQDTAPALAAGRETGAVLRQAGFNLDFAPVCDVNVNPENPVIGKIGRSFAATPQAVSACAGAFARGLHEHGVLTALKHFPGHGSSTSDSHLGFTDVTATWSDAELEPFAELARRGLGDMVMTAHVFNARLDPKYPSTLSDKVITGILRKRLGFDGVVVTDDLQMRAIADHYGFKEALRLAVLAGADILLIGNNLQYEEDIATKAVDALMELVAEGRLGPGRIAQSYARIQKLKERLAAAPQALARAQ